MAAGEDISLAAPAASVAVIYGRAPGTPDAAPVMSMPAPRATRAALMTTMHRRRQSCACSPPTIGRRAFTGRPSRRDDD